MRRCLRTLTSRSQCTACEQNSPRSPFPRFGNRTSELTGGNLCVEHLLHSAVTHSCDSDRGFQQQQAPEKFIWAVNSRRRRRCANPRGAPSVSLQPPGVTGAPRSETEPLPGELGVSLRAAAAPQRWHLCFVLFAVPCLALGSFTCSRMWNGFISPFRPQIGFAEVVLTRDHAVM